MNQARLRGKMIVSLIVALFLSVIYLPATLQIWAPPLVTLVLFYWLIFRTTTIGVWGVWLVGLLAGLLQGDPLGICSLIMVLLAWPLLYHQRTMQFMAASSCWLLWLLLVAVSIVLKVLLLSVFGYASMRIATFKPILSVIILSPIIYLALSLFSQLTFARKRLS